MTISDKEFYNYCKQFLNSNMSIRQFSQASGVPRSTFHSAIHDRLPLIDKKLYIQVCEKLNKNFKNRHTFSGYRK